jgi:2-methylcitrate dehydratase PrpD
MTKQGTREPTRILANFAARLRYGDLPQRSREHCKDLILDALACALAGYQGEETVQIRALASALAQGQESSVIGGAPLSLVGAALFNGYLITAVTMCDVHRATMTHVTPEIVPPALAIAERDDLSGRDLLVAVAAGCEVTTRIGLGLDYPAFRARGWHGPGNIGPFGAAAAVGSLLKFDADTMARSFGLAGSQAAGTFAAWGTPTVKFHQCRGAISGPLADGALSLAQFTPARYDDPAALRASARRVRESAVARPGGAKIPALCRRHADRRPDPGGDWRGEPAGGFRFGAGIDGPVARVSADTCDGRGGVIHDPKQRSLKQRAGVRF